MQFKDGIYRCSWIKDDPDYLKYHDKEWGVPQYDDHKLFELLILESAEAGLNWLMILKKRENYRLAYHNFDPNKVAAFNEEQESELLNNNGIIKSKLKIKSSRQNAKRFLEIQKEYGSFSSYIWHYVDHKPILNNWLRSEDVPNETLLSLTICKDMKERGFTFIGSRIIYAFMQAIGLVNDHTTYCFKYHKNSDISNT
jgi:DNA-3-methyladenine glycosylase I